MVRRFEDRDGMDRAARDAVRAALRRHMLLGESVAVSDGKGGVNILCPEEIGKALEQQ
jgi:hypothetical protein